MKYSEEGSPWLKAAAVLTGFTSSLVYLREAAALVFWRKLYGPSPRNMTPLEEAERQIANFRRKLKAAANREGSPILARPRPARPVAPLARPWRRNVGAQVNSNRGTVTDGPGLEPSVEMTETTSSASSPPVAVRVKGLSGKVPQVLLLQPGLGPLKQSPHEVDRAREHWADLQRAGLYEDET